MAVRLTEGEKKYTGGTAIEITANRVVNLLLREENNLIKIDDNEIYCDLQLQDGLTPSDTIPVGVTTGRVVEADGWIKSGTILCFKTTSGDYVKRIYGDDGKLYIDNGTGTFKQIYLKPEIDALLQDLDARKQDLLISGTNIKTLNNESLLGSGNITITGTLPQGGTVGQVLTKTADGAEWADIDRYVAGPGIIIGDYNDYSAMRGPCPEGYHVPTSNEWDSIISILTTTFGLPGNSSSVGTYLKMPTTGYRTFNGSSVGAESNGDYWTSSTNDSASYFIKFNSSLLKIDDSWRANGFPIRPSKDKASIPNSSWTTLYDGSSIAIGAGIFRDSTGGLISISGDGETRYTISDKNLGATVVCNYGDTLTDLNRGNYYQRGNNYGFAPSGAVTVTTTKVDASGYGPGNYYYSDIFIKTNAEPNDWSSVQNNNLRGGVTGVVTIHNAIYIDVDFVRGLIN